jgi:hypothetical protein
MGIEFGAANDDKVQGRICTSQNVSSQDTNWQQVNNIRELLGHKVDLAFIERNPAVRLEKT